MLIYYLLLTLFLIVNFARLPSLIALQFMSLNETCMCSKNVVGTDSGIQTAGASSTHDRPGNAFSVPHSERHRETLFWKALIHFSNAACCIVKVNY